MLYGRLALDPERESIFHKMMASVSRLVGRGAGAASGPLSAHHLFDVGGGTAVNAPYLARRWPNLRVTIADLPTVAETVNAKVAALGLNDRVRAVGLDVFEDEFPEGCDAVLFVRKGKRVVLAYLERLHRLDAHQRGELRYAPAQRPLGPGITTEACQQLMPDFG
jgi:hypothetical protein